MPGKRKRKTATDQKSKRQKAESEPNVDDAELVTKQSSNKDTENIESEPEVVDNKAVAKKSTKKETEKKKSTKKDTEKNSTRKKTEKIESDPEVEDKKTVSKKSTKKKKSPAKAADEPVYTAWLMKSEPESRFENGVDVKFGIEDLKKEPEQTACWDGVRNYQARNFMHRQMKLNQRAFFYHSNTKEPGIAGIVEIVKEGYPDHTAWDPEDPHYDKRRTNPMDPCWFMVDVKFERMMKRYIRLSELKALHLKHKANGGPLRNMALFTRARLSVQPVSEEEWDFILQLENEDGD